MRHQILIRMLRWLGAILVLRVLLTILYDYPDYFPPNFESLFLQGREMTFVGVYKIAFYTHILSAPFALVNGLVLLNESFRRLFPRIHRLFGRIQILVLLGLVLPSGVVMSRHSYGGWSAGLSFLMLSVVTAGCAIIGVVHARNRCYTLHRRWMIRCYALISSAVFLRLISGAALVAGVASAEEAYIFAAWSSWLAPLTLCFFLPRNPVEAVAGPEKTECAEWH